MPVSGMCSGAQSLLWYFQILLTFAERRRCDTKPAPGTPELHYILNAAAVRRWSAGQLELWLPFVICLSVEDITNGSAAVKTPEPLPG